MSQEVPEAVFDTAAAMAGIKSQMVSLLAERDAVAAEYIAAMKTMVNDRDHRSLLAAIDGFKIVHGSGWLMRLNAAGLPKRKSVLAHLQGACNDGEGRWRGSFPLDPTSHRPTRGTWVVYRLLMGGDLLYIGSTGAFIERVKAHARTKVFDSWQAAECADEVSCRELESALIDRYRPPLNRMIPTPRLVLT